MYMKQSFTTNIKTLAVALLLAVSIGAMGANAKQTVSQVTSAVEITADWDYTITSAQPFGSEGVVNIVNTDHAVVILTKVKPSAGIKLLESHVKINGQKAVDGTNCQVKMYNKGCIIMPYASDFKPLTCFSDTDFSGTSYNGYTMGSNGGYMKTLTDTELKNNFKSFKLKRGYMVAFATGTAGWGYSRCFIADTEDLEMNLPAVLSGKVSSYRLFKWQNFGKTGIANDTRAEVCDALNVQGCYTYDTGGNGRLPDVEWLPHKIHPVWPGVAACGDTEYACTMKTDNEPANPDDDEPASVEQVLGYWEDAMRTGLRLCSPSSWDGNMNWQKTFFEAIDARGWRCDLYDLHCYWTDFNGLYSHYNTYKRPLLISEWMWGHSWSGGAGAFGSGVTEQQIINNTSNILNTLNNAAYVERYFYWNSESKANVYKNGSLTSLGRTYAATDGGLGYNKSYEFVPKVVVKKPYSLAGTVSGNDISLTWKDSNGDMMDEICVQYKSPSASTWTTLATIDRKDKTGRSDQSYSYTGTLDNAEDYEWRIQDTFESETHVSNTLKKVTSSVVDAAFLPTNPSDFYFQFYSKEAGSNLVWAISPAGENRVQYKAYNSNHGEDPYQLWMLEPNSNGGYSLRNLGEPDYLIASPASWNFVTRNSDYTEEAPQAAFGLEYISSGNYWVCRNLYHNMYVGLWDNDKVFAAGEVLAGNRDSEATADHIGIRMILRSELEGGDVSPVEEATVGKSYYLYNVDAGMFLTSGNSYGTAASLGVSGLLWTLEDGNNSGMYSFKNSSDGNKYLYVSGEDRMWVDGSASIGSPWEDVTSTYITNANMSSTTGWTIKNQNGNPTAGASNKDAYAIEFYAGWDNVNVTSYSALQSITLPAGTYKLTSQAFYREGQLYNTSPNTSRANLKAGSKTTKLPTLGSVTLNNYANTLAEAADALASDTYETSIEFTLSTSSTIEIGVTGTFSVAKSWCAVGAFKLYKKGEADATQTRDFKLDLDNDGFYTMQVDPNNVNYGTGALGTRYVGFVGDLSGTPYVLSCPKESYHSGVGSKWLFMDGKAYLVYREKAQNALAARQQMWPVVISARAAGVGEDEIAIYENPLSSASEIESAMESLKAKLLEVEASESTPVDYSFLITNGDCASSSFEGWTTDNSWGSNTTFYHNGDALLTNRFYESWVNGPATLGDRTLSQTFADLPSGVYRLSLDVIATQQSDATKVVTGVTLFLGDQEVGCHTANGVPETFTTPKLTVTEGSSVTLGMKVESTTANWVAFDNFRLIYLGLPPVPNDLTNDRRVDAADVRALVSHLLGNTPENFNIDAANINGDKEVNISDVTALIEIILRLQNSLPASSDQTTGEASSNQAME